MRLTLLAIVLVVDSSVSDIIRRAIFDCQRMDVGFCCTSRVRRLCVEQCKYVQCGVPDGNSKFHLESITSPPHSHDGLVQLSRPSLSPPPPPPLPPPPPPPPPPPLLSFIPSAQTQEPLSSRTPLTVTSPTQSPFIGFPTLIPFEPNIDSRPNTERWSAQFTTAPPIRSTTIKSLHHRARTTPDPRIIKPPESLVIIGEYDEETTTDNLHQPTVPSIPTDLSHASIFPWKVNNTVGGGILPNSFVSEEVTEDKEVNRGDSSGWTPKRFCALMMNSRRCRTRMRSYTSRNVNVDHRTMFVTTSVLLPPPHHRRQIRQRLSRPQKSWRVKILPPQQVITWPEGVERLPRFIVDGTASRHGDSNHKELSTFIKRFSVGPSKFSGQIEFTDVPDIEFVAHSRTTLAPHQILMKPLRPYTSIVKPSTRRIPFSSTPSYQFTRGPSLTFVKQPPPALTPPPIPQQQFSSAIITTTMEPCGVAPNFKPCVTSEQASHALLDCCRRKGLPPGCLPLCRYDITQAEVRSAMDRGQCGLFSVTPYLECASQGHDNTECCRYKGIVTKTGPQCEQFCRPSHGIGILGLQHIVCGNAIGEMMQCHHSGIRL